MVKNALGLIEIVGLAAAVAAADAAVKAANIKIIGYELTKGGGLVLVKLCGDVGGVKVAVEAGRIAGGKVNKVWSTHVIPRLHQELACILEPAETVEKQEQQEALMASEVQEIVKETEMIAEEAEQSEVQPEVEVEIQVEVQTEVQLELQADVQPEVQPNTQAEKKRPADICNLCSDPACHRKKGDPKITCIYYGKNNKEAE